MYGTDLSFLYISGFNANDLYKKYRHLPTFYLYTDKTIDFYKYFRYNSLKTSSFSYS